VRNLIPLPNGLAQVPFKCSEDIASIGGIAAVKCQFGDAFVVNKDPAAQLIDAMIEFQE
jgi:hypothetical protein